MKIGLFLLDDNNIVGMNASALQFAKRNRQQVIWHSSGTIERNDILIYIGKPMDAIKERFYDACANLGGQRCCVFISRFHEEDCIPLVKEIDSPSGETWTMDTVFSDRKITIDANLNEISVTVDGQHCILDSHDITAGQLVVIDRDGIKYYGSKDGDNSIDDILESLSFGERFNKEDYPIALKEFFNEDMVRIMGKISQDGIERNISINGKRAVVKLLEKSVGIKQNVLISIGDEGGYLDALETYSKSYNELYFGRQIKVASNELGCEARLKGCGKAIEDINKQLDKVCRKNVTIVLTGESGTGKTFLARQIHKNSRRREGPFVNVNCASIAYNLIESELFGYEDGAFTGAKRGGKVGYFELAKGGTLFLDEISEVPIKLQGKLLEVLQEGTFYRVGGTQKINCDIRLIVATNKNLEEMVKGGSFREDLYYRINVFPIKLPPLRERLDDLYAIVEDALPAICERLEIEPLMLSRQALEKMRSYFWPGNIRELENVLEKAAVMANGSLINEDDIVLENSVAMRKKTTTLKEAIEDLEKDILTRTFKQFGGDRRMMAEYLGLSKTNLFDKIHKYGIDDRRE